MFKNYLFILVLGLLSLFAQDAFAVTAVPWPVDKVQPDGTSITVYLRGDEKVHWMESLDGYTLMYDDQKYVVYAKQDARGNMVPSNVRYGSRAVRVAFPKGLRYSEAQVEALKQIWEVTSEPGRQRSQGQQRIGSTVGERKALCVLVGFSDKAFGKDRGDYDILFNQLGLAQIDPATKGSVRDFFRENSYGQLDFTVTIVGPYTAPNTAKYYATHEREFATFAAQAANADVNYNDFADSGILETFHILFAGYGDENIDNGEQIWSHKWQLASPITLDGVRISVYSCSPELRGSSGSNITYIGVVCHELSHVFGAPDYYDTSYSGFEGTGNWDLMAQGSWNDNGRQPAHINMFQKILYGWVNPVALTAQTDITDMPASALNPVAYTVQVNDNGELYVLDNRQKTGFDSSLPGHGLLIWHVHPAALGGSGSNSGHPQQLYPVVASSMTAIPNATSSSYGAVNSAGAPFPGTSGKTSFTGKTTPAMFTWTGNQPVAWPVTEITEASGGTISFKFLDGPTDPITNLQANVSGNDVQLTWTPPARSDIQGYRIFRDGVLVYTTNNASTVSYTQLGVLKGNYEYCVSVTYEATESPKTCLPVAVTSGSDTFYLPVSGLQATAGINEVSLNWTAPFTGGWTGIAGDYAGAYTFGEPWDFFAGTLWNPSDLNGLDGYQISKVKFVPIETITSGATYAVVVYEVPASGAPQLVYTQPVTGTLDYSGVYNEVTLNTPLTIDASKGVIVGMQVHTVGGSCLPISQGDAYPGRNIFYDVDGWYALEDIGVGLGENYCLQVYLEGTAGSPVLPNPNIPANTSFLKKSGHSRQLIAGERIPNVGFSQAPSAVATYNIYRDGVKVGTSITTSYTDAGLSLSTTYAYCVTVEYTDGGLSEGVCIETRTDTPYKPVTNLTASVVADEVSLTWEPQNSYTVLFSEDFEGGIPATWTNVDADGDAYSWALSPVAIPQSGNQSVYSASYINGVGPLTPDNWLVSPAITLTDNNKLTYYVSAQDASWAEENYGVYISTSNAVPGTFSSLLEETMTGSPGRPVDNPAPGAFRSAGPQYAQGTWYERTIDLSAYSGQTVYIAFRHFNCTDMFYLNLDNVKIVVPIDAGNITYNVYEGSQSIASGLTSPQHTVSNVEVGTHTYCVTAVYDGANESEAVCVDVERENPFRPVANLKASVVADEVSLTWEPQIEYTTLFSEDFEGGIPATWTNVDADGDSYSWEVFSYATPQSGNRSVSSASYDLYGFVPLTPDNWLVSPAVTLTDDNKLTYYVSALEETWPEEHYGVYISTSNAVPGTFSLLFEETMTGSPGKPVVHAPGALRPTGPQYAQGTWYKRTIDLSAYSGQTVYIAFRHFDCTDQLYLNLDNIKIVVPVSAGDITYNVFEESNQIASGLTSPQYTLSNVEVGTHTYCVTAVYNGADESRAECIDVKVVPLSNPYRPVYNLVAAMTEPFKGELSWNAPVFTGKLRHHTFDGGAFNTVTINGSNIDIDVAVRFTPEDLAGVDGLMLTKVRFIPVGSKEAVSYSVRVWVGGSNPSDGTYVPGQMVVDQEIPAHVAFNWNEIVLNTPVPIDRTKEIWIGLRCQLPATGYTAPLQAVNTLNGKGNLIFLNGTWTALTDLVPFEGNWIIDGIVAYHQGLDPSASLPVLTDEGRTASGGTLSAAESGTVEPFTEQAPTVPTVAKYLITRDGEELGETTATTFVDEVTTAATHNYCVQVVYDNEGLSDPACVDLTYVQTPISITNAAIEAKTYDGTTEATVTSVTFNDGTNELSLTLDEDFSATAEFDDPNAGTGKTVTVTVTLLKEAYVLNELTFELTNQSIAKAIPDYTVPVLTALDGQTLGDLVLPQGWTWDEPLTTPVGALGTQQHPATYTPDDLTNYEIVTAIPVSIIVTITPAYDVTILASDNGSVASDKLFAEAGELVTLTASPDAGYEVDEVKAVKTGDEDTTVDVDGSGLTYSFAMPAYAVSVQTTFRKTDAQILAEAKDLLEAATYTVNQATANTVAQVTNWLVQQINNQIRPTGVSVSASDIAISSPFTAAIEGTASVPNGTNGSFDFTATLTLNAASATTGSINGTIIAQTYTPPVVPEEIFYYLNIPDVEGLITNWRPGVYEVSENTYVTLTFQAAEGYSLDDLQVYANGAGQTLTTNAEGVYALVLGYLNEDIAISIEGVKQSTSVGIIAPSQTSLKVVKADGGLYVYGLTPGLEFRIYNVSGILVYKGKATATEQFVALSERGFYLIISEGTNAKVAF
jgi:M6 family metalloprotease-like protein